MPAGPVPFPSPVCDHGGNLGAARRRFPGAPEPWIDLSTGINPWPYPFLAPPPEAWQRLPDDDAFDCLLRSAALAYGAPSPDHVAAAPGSQALIQWLPRLVRPGRVAILVPTYGEHAVAWATAGHTVTVLADPGALDPDSWDTVVVVNPNNPDGRQIEVNRLRTLARHLSKRNGRLVVDEAFADALTGTSLAGATDEPGLVVLRSFGKFFGLAGLRLGFALADPATIKQLRAALGPWPVSGPAVAIALHALSDAPWIAATRARLEAAARRLDGTLEAHGLRVIGGTPLFRLSATADAGRLFEALAAAGILVRRFDAYPNWLRFGLPPDEPAWQRLEEALP